MQRTLLVLIAISAATACAEQTPLTPPAANGPAFNFSNGPATPGPIVFRTEDDFFLLFNSDPVTGLTSLIRLPDPPDDVLPCGGAQPLGPADLQLAFHPNGAINQLLVGHDARAYLYDRQAFRSAQQQGGICGAITSLTPLAHGTVSFVAHDNDTFFSGTRTNAFGWSAKGTVTAASDGAALRYANQYHGAVAPDGSVLHILSRITTAAH